MDPDPPQNVMDPQHWLEQMGSKIQLNLQRRLFLVSLFLHDSQYIKKKMFNFFLGGKGELV